VEFRNRNSLRGWGTRATITSFAERLHMPANDLTETICAALSGATLFSGGLLRTMEPSVVWRFTSQLPAQTLTLFRREKAAAVVTSDVIGLGVNWTCWVVGYQVGGSQHRWFLPLAGTQVGSLLREVRETGLRLWMDGEAEKSVFEARMPVSTELGSTLRKQWALSADSTAVAENLLRTAAQLLTPASLKPAEGSAPASYVSVTAVIPRDLRLDPASDASAALWRASRSTHQGRYDA
jgi:hypothetical protein